MDDVDPRSVFAGTAGFDAYVRHHAQALCRSAFLLTGDRHLAEDLVQAALAKVALRWDRVVAKGDPAPYVRTVIVRTVLVAMTVTVICAVLAFPMAFFMAKIASPRGRRILIVAVLTPLWASYLVKAYAWRGMFSADTPPVGGATS